MKTLFPVVGLFLAVGCGRPADPTPPGRPVPSVGIVPGVAATASVDGWTYVEMAEHLKKRGFAGWHYMPYKSKGAMFVGDANGEPGATAGLNIVFDHGVAWADDAVVFEQFGDPEAARQFVGHRGKGVVAYQRWVFYGSGATLAKAKSAFP